MIKEARGFGEDITEAQENARINLGVSADADVQYEIISQNKKKVFGIFGGSKAEVRAYVELPDEPQKKVKAPKKDKAQPEKTVSRKKENEKKEVKAEPKKNTQKSLATDFTDLVDEDKLNKDGKAVKAIAYLRAILKEFGVENPVFKAKENEDGAYIQIDGENVGPVIGRRGETLDALQYLSGLAANNCGGYFKVSLNIGDYREKRENALVELATKVAQQVLSNGRSKALEPMNPYERRIIHTAIQEIDGVVSNSIGDGQNRRVVIYSENGDMKPPRIGNNRRSRNSRDRRPAKKSNTVEVVSTREPKKDTDIPLYGKIN